MKTPAHAAIGYLIAEAVPGARLSKKWVIAGAIAPDAALVVIILSLMAGGDLPLMPNLAELDAALSLIYFAHPLCIAAHSLLHSPVSLALLFLLCEAFAPTAMRPAAHSFLAGAASHSFLDILTHHDDGPLLFWPFGWQTRFASPVSHWDIGHHAAQLATVELMIVVLALAHLTCKALNRSRQPVCITVSCVRLSDTV